MSYCVAYIERASGKVEAVIARGLYFHIADQLAASMYDRAREGMYFKAVNENHLPETS